MRLLLLLATSLSLTACASDPPSLSEPMTAETTDAANESSATETGTSAVAVEAPPTVDPETGELLVPSAEAAVEVTDVGRLGGGVGGLGSHGLAQGRRVGGREVVAGHWSMTHRTARENP